ncbi:hypothetical protein BXZ70DRAFT_959786 [Cristinia sonorae]|uniref:Uncharacterized protein n=1 Tax=Cristinia sonorae TaxID=1940300 RepID=A0A8K0UFL7_9AGAR|nr:hypothetical protein BXZ70DRAFT_959786 [Cristinia sonorae]
MFKRVRAERQHLKAFNAKVSAEWAAAMYEMELATAELKRERAAMNALVETAGEMGGDKALNIIWTTAHENPGADARERAERALAAGIDLSLENASERWTGEIKRRKVDAHLMWPQHGPREDEPVAPEIPQNMISLACKCPLSPDNAPNPPTFRGDGGDDNDDGNDGDNPGGPGRGRGPSPPNHRKRGRSPSQDHRSTHSSQGPSGSTFDPYRADIPDDHPLKRRRPAHGGRTLQRENAVEIDPDTGVDRAAVANLCRMGQAADIQAASELMRRAPADYYIGDNLRTLGRLRPSPHSSPEMGSSELEESPIRAGLSHPPTPRLRPVQWHSSNVVSRETVLTAGGRTGQVQVQRTVVQAQAPPQTIIPSGPLMRATSLSATTNGNYAAAGPSGNPYNIPYPQSNVAGPSQVRPPVFRRPDDWFVRRGRQEEEEEASISPIRSNDSSIVPTSPISPEVSMEEAEEEFTNEAGPSSTSSGAVDQVSMVSSIRAGAARFFSNIRGAVQTSTPRSTESDEPEDSGEMALPPAFAPPPRRRQRRDSPMHGRAAIFMQSPPDVSRVTGEVLRDMGRGMGFNGSPMRYADGEEPLPEPAIT